MIAGAADLKFIHGAYPCIPNAVRQIRNLCIVRSDNEHVVQPQRRTSTLSSIQFTPACKTVNKDCDTLDLFCRSVLIALVTDRNESEIRFTQPCMSFDLLVLESLARVESPLVENLRSEVTEPCGWSR